MAIQPKNNTDIKVDQIDEKTSGAGVLVENVLIKDSGVNYLQSGGSSSAYTLTFSPAYSALVDGMEFRFRANHKSTTTCTLNVNGIGAKNIVDSLGNALKAECIQIDAYITCVYDADNDQFVVAGERFTPLNTYTCTPGAATGTWAPTITEATYKLHGDMSHFFVRTQAATPSSSTNYLTLSSPYPLRNMSGSNLGYVGCCYISFGTSADEPGHIFAVDNGSDLRIYRANPSSNFPNTETVLVIAAGDLMINF